VELRFWDGIYRPPPSTDEVIYVHKDPAFVARLDAVLTRVQPRRIIEIGVLDGGSTIYWQSQYDLERLVAFERAPEAPCLTRYLQRNNLTDRVRVHFDLSQDDGPRLRAALAADIGDDFVDAIIDDASHQYAETKATIEALFPFLRPGGVYIIEDWAWGHNHKWPQEMWADSPLMSPLISELILICGHASGVIDKIEIDRNFAALWRGLTNLPRDGSFKLSDHYIARAFSIAL